MFPRNVTQQFKLFLIPYFITRHFDKEKTGRLSHNEFKSCLRALGYDLPVVDEGETEPEFELILDIVDPNRDGFIALQV